MPLIGQVIRFGLAGGTAVAVLFAVLVVLVEAAGVPETPASAAAFTCAVPVNYILQYHFVFRQTRRHIDCFPRYVGVTLGTVVLNTMLFWLLSDLVGLYYVVAQLFTIVAVAVASYVANRYYTFAAVQPALRSRP